MKKGMLVFCIVLIVSMLLSAVGCVSVYAPTDSHDRTLVTAPKSSAPVTSAMPSSPSVGVPAKRYVQGEPQANICAALREVFPSSAIINVPYAGMVLPAKGTVSWGYESMEIQVIRMSNGRLGIWTPTYLRIDPRIRYSVNMG